MLGEIVSYAVWGAGGLLGIGMLTSCVVITGQQTARIVETFGKFSSVRTAGLSFKWPAPFQTLSDEISLQIQQISATVAIKSSDNALLNMKIHAQFRVDENSVADAHYKLVDGPRQIESYLVNQVRSSVSGKTFVELYSDKDDLERQAKEALKDRMGQFGYIIENVLLDDPEPSEEMRRSFDDVLSSERRLEAKKNDAEAMRIGKVAEAKAEAESLELRAAALVNFRKVVTEGNAAAIKEFVEGTGLTEKDALSFILGINEMETLGRIGEAGGKVVYISAAAREAGADLTAALVQASPAGEVAQKAGRKAKAAAAS